MKKNQTLLGLILTIGFLVGFVGCNKDPVILTGITLNTETVKTEYTVGDEFTTEGLVVTANYSNGTSKEVVNWTADGFDSTVATESQTITISYTEDGETVTATYTIVIKENDADTPVDDDPAGDDPSDEGDKPEGEGDKPEGEGDKPEGEGDKPEGEGDKPEGEGDKPEGEGDDPAEENPPVKATFQITYETAYGSVEPKTVEEGYVLTEADLPVLTQEGYDFVGWNLKVGDKITAATKITATWIPFNNVEYTIEHYQQNLEDENYTIVTSDTEKKSGKKLEDTEAATKEYPGFTAKTFKQEKIAADGSTVVKIYYDRNSYTIKFDTDGGTKINDITLKYGAKITVPAAPTKADYEFKKWDPALPSTMPAKDMTLKAIWEKNESLFNITLDKNNSIKMDVYSEEKTIYFEVPEGYVSYAWYLNGSLVEEKSNKYTIITDALDNDPDPYSGSYRSPKPLNKYENGMYDVLAVVEDSNGEYYSATATFIIDNIPSFN